MEFVITVVLLIIAYQISVNTNNRRQIKNLRNQVLTLSDKVLEANQHYEMILLYGKAKQAEKEAIKEEGNNKGQRAGQASNEAINEQ